jgi:hypothetical protein
MGYPFRFNAKKKAGIPACLFQCWNLTSDRIELQARDVLKNKTDRSPLDTFLAYQRYLDFLRHFLGSVHFRFRGQHKIVHWGLKVKGGIARGFRFRPQHCGKIKGRRPSG